MQQFWECLKRNETFIHSGYFFVRNFIFLRLNDNILHVKIVIIKSTYVNYSPYSIMNLPEVIFKEVNIC